MAMGAVTSLMVMMTMASMMIFNLMTKMILIIGNANYDKKMKRMMTMLVLQGPDRRNDHHEYKDENNDDNLAMQGPDGRGYITQPFSGPSYSPGRSGLALSS